LDQVLSSLPRVANERVLIGFETSDDAGVYKLTDECALVQTVDFFTPIVDDPFTFGAVAAVNALSDVYAMGGTPVTALSVLCYPGKGDLDDLREILCGGASKMAEAGCAIVGGHSVNDEEVKFGYAITGTVHPARVKANSGARAGDVLLFTKSIGTGVISTAHKRGLAAPEHVEAAIASMLTLNNINVEWAHGLTDVTGFGLLGHAREMALASNVTLEIDRAAVRYLPGALEYARLGALPGGLHNNRDFASCSVEASPSMAPEVESLLYDPQTAGGLLISIAPADAGRIKGAYAIGRVLERQEKPLRIL
jgi:selenide, water dikinase